MKSKDTQTFVYLGSFVERHYHFEYVNLRDSAGMHWVLKFFTSRIPTHRNLISSKQSVFFYSFRLDKQNAKLFKKF